jgi:hypothetical protein
MTLRGEILNEAKRLTEDDRNKTYGEPYENMDAFADLLTGYLKARRLLIDGVELDAEDGAAILGLSKKARRVNRELPYHKDNYTDEAAYSAMEGEIAEFCRSI